MTTQSIQRIWQVAKLIPIGKVASYGQVADLAGLPGRARLTSKALGAAPLELQLPWHRILRSSGHIAFPKGHENATLQHSLLTEEGVVVRSMRVDMNLYRWQPDLNTLLYQLDF
ncbi:methylated-DNA--[protein]-cysteine S-methyltransferase [Alteromonas sp. ASW11-36]|uniref:Methylated-DNA--[protein]-cysteine S-methyltransferase n=1 Tax=Alteromonas arenosi TaxID=3055817 RepID=A0ABT7T0W4_9ALTE|nr:methylated-DNA--[protein]-cysteine S-methyltransferase [Alteromonas sp. ASW11-36]MDM7862091.1 methylated-DNA--[protein]-cysteine S-methyltransferase [Alteromonas sp. ASW11-36]